MAKDDVEEVVYTPSTEQVYLASLTEESEPPVFNAAVNPNPFHEDGYVGVSAEYANAANETDEPLESEEGPEAEAEAAFADAYGDASGEVTPQMQEAVAKVTRQEEPAAKAAPAKKAAPKSDS